MPCRSEPDEYYRDNSVFLLIEILRLLPNRNDHGLNWGKEGTQAVNALCRLLKKLDDAEWTLIHEKASEDVLRRLKRWQKEHLDHDNRRALANHKTKESKKQFELPSPESPRKVFPNTEQSLFHKEYTALGQVSGYAQSGQIALWAQSIYIHNTLGHAVLKQKERPYYFEVILLIDELLELCHIKTPIEKIWPFLYYPIFDVPLVSNYIDYRYEHDFIERYFRFAHYDYASAFDRLILEAFDHKYHPLKFRRTLVLMLSVIVRALSEQCQPWNVGHDKELEAILTVHPVVSYNGTVENVSSLIHQIIDLGDSFFNHSASSYRNNHSNAGANYRDKSSYRRHSS